jgi:hypothetical protein
MEYSSLALENSCFTYDAMDKKKVLAKSCILPDVFLALKINQ